MFLNCYYCIAPKLNLKEVINLSDDNLVNIKKLEISFTQLHTRKLNKKLRKQVYKLKIDSIKMYA